MVVRCSRLCVWRAELRLVSVEPRGADSSVVRMRQQAKLAQPVEIWKAMASPQKRHVTDFEVRCPFCIQARSA